MESGKGASKWLSSVSVFSTIALTLCSTAFAQEKIACGLVGPDAITLDGDQVYFGQANGLLSRAPKTPIGDCTSAAQTLAADALLSEGNNFYGINRISFSPTHIYFGYGGYTNHRIEELQRQRTLRRTVVERTGRFLSVLSEYVYFFGADLYRISTTPGATAELLAQGLFPRSNVDDGFSLFFFDLNFGTLYRLDASNPQQLVTLIVASAEGLVLANSTDVFLTYPDGRVRKTSKLGGVVTDLNVGVNAWARAVDDSYFYFTQGDALRRVPLSGGASELLAQPVSVQNSTPFNMVVDANYLYWIDVSGGNNAGVIYRLSKTGNSTPLLPPPSVQQVQLRPDPPAPQQVPRTIVPPVQSITKNLVFITHGWNSYVDLSLFSGDSSVAKPIAEKISNIIELRNPPNEDWTVMYLDWRVDAGEGCGLPCFGPWTAFVHAGLLGDRLGRVLAPAGFDHIHFIAHSAGSNLIETAAAQVKALSTRPEKPTIHS